MNTNIVVKRPIITEKSFRDSAFGVYTFEVDLQAAKGQIRNEVEKLFKVHVTDIKTLIVKGKRRVFGKKRILKKQKDIKKARVQLAKGENIPLFESGKVK